MSHPCIAPEDFGEVSSWPEDSPARRHLENCARCLALYRDYLAFLDHDAPAGVGSDAAVALLGRLIDREFKTSDPAAGGVEDGEETADVPSGGAKATSGPARSRSWMAFVRRSVSFARLRPRLAYSIVPALALVAVAVVLVARTKTEAPHVAVLRGPEAPFALRLGPPEKQSDGGIRLTWSAVPGADAYRVVISGTDLQTLRDTTVEANSVMIRPPSDRRAHGPGSTRLLWTVTALHDRSVVLESDVGSFLAE